MRRFFQYLLLLIVFLGIHSNLHAAVTVNLSHPRIMLNATILAEVQAKVAIGQSKAADFATILAWCEANYGNMTNMKVDFLEANNYLDSGELRYALVYVLGTISGHSYTHTVEQHGAQAVLIAKQRIADNLSTPSGTTDFDYVKSVSIVYDWCYPLLTAQDKSDFATWLISTIPAVLDVNDENLIVRPGSRISSTPKCLYPALAFYGDTASATSDAKAVEYFDFIMSTGSYAGGLGWMDGDARASSLMAGKDGGHAAGPAYGLIYYPPCYKIHESYYALYTATTGRTLEEWVGEYHYIKGWPEWLLHNFMPGVPRYDTRTGTATATMSGIGDMGDYEMWNMDDARKGVLQVLQFAAYLAIKQSDTDRAGWITWMIDNIGGGQTLTTFDILWDESPTSLTPDEAVVNPVKLFGWNTTTGVVDSYSDRSHAGVGQLFIRPDWTGIGSASTNTYVTFNNTPYYYFGHQHSQNLSFTISKGDPLAMEQLVYYHHYEGCDIDRTEAGCLSGGLYQIIYPLQWYVGKRLSPNIPLIMDPGETIKHQTVNDSTMPTYSDGGQRAQRDAWIPYDRIDDNTVLDLGNFTAFEDTANYTYSSADATKAYNTIKAGKDYSCWPADPLETDCTEYQDPKVSLVQRDLAFSKSADGTGDYVVVFDRITATDDTFKKVFLMHTIGKPALNDASPTAIYGNGTNGLFSSIATNYVTAMKASGAVSKLHWRIVFPTSTTVYTAGETVTSTLTEDITAVDGITQGGTKMHIHVANASVFPDKPIVTILGSDYGALSPWYEAFMCDGKDEVNNLLTDCIRGLRYSRANGAVTHSSGATVTQYYNWMYRTADTDEWIGHPRSYGLTYVEFPHDNDEHGRWTIRVESVPTTGEYTTNFLNVFFPTSNLSATMPTTTGIAASVGTQKGVIVQDATNPRVFMFSVDNTKVRDTKYSVTHSGTAKHLITGLEKSYEYNLFKDGKWVQSATTSDQGTYYFTATQGEFELKSVYILDDYTVYSLPGACTAADVPYSWCTGVGAPVKPPKGEEFIDPTFGTKIVRITDSATDHHGTYDYAQPGYVKHDIENADGSYVLIQSLETGSSGHHIYQGVSPYALIKDVPTGIIETVVDEECRWDPTNTEILYCHKGLKLYQWDVSAGDSGSLRKCADYPTDNPCYLHNFDDDFTDAVAYITMGEEGRPSDDGRYWAFVTVNTGALTTQTHMFVYDKTTDTVILSKDRGAGSFTPLGVQDYYMTEFVWPRDRTTGELLNYNAIGMSHSGSYIFSTGPPTWFYPIDGSTTRVLNAHGHCDTGYDDEGREVALWVHAKGDPASDYSYWLVMADLATGTWNWIAPWGDVQLFHVSSLAFDRPGWAVLYSDSPEDSPDPVSWSDQSIFVYEVTRRVASPTDENHGIIWKVAHSRRNYQSYGDGSYAKFNKDGTAIYFGSGWGYSFHDAPYDTYKIILPTYWEENITLTGEDTTDPIISTPTPTADQTCTTDPLPVTIQVLTEDTATCKYSTTDVAYASMTGVFDYTGFTTHYATIDHACGDSYTYYVRCMDDSGNINDSSTSISFDVFPTVGSANIGYTSTPTTGYYSLGGIRMAGTQFTAPDNGNANPGILYAYAGATTGTPEMTCAVYNDNGSNDFSGQTKVSSDATFNLSVGASWRAAMIDWTGIVAGRKYWILCSGEANSMWYYTSSSKYARYKGYTYSGTMPNPAPTSTVALTARDFGAYVNYEGGDITPPVRSDKQPSSDNQELYPGVVLVKMSLTTSEPAYCKWSNSPGVAYASMTGSFDYSGIMKTSHSDEIGVGTASYVKYVKCIDAFGNANADDYVISWTVPSPTPGVNYTVIPMPRWWPGVPTTLSDDIALRDPVTQPINVVFFGDSITGGWSDTIPKTTFQAYWGDYCPTPLSPIGDTCNFGIGGDRIQTVAWRMLYGDLDGYTPKVITVSIGINNSETAVQKIAGLQNIISIIQSKQPTAKILLISITPTNNTPPSQSSVNIAVNAWLATQDNGNTIRYLDLWPVFLQEDGVTPIEGVFAPEDSMHLGAYGYQLWAAAMDPLLDSMIEDGLPSIKRCIMQGGNFP